MHKLNYPSLTPNSIPKFDMDYSSFFEIFMNERDVPAELNIRDDIPADDLDSRLAFGKQLAEAMVGLGTQGRQCYIAAHSSITLPLDC